MERKYWATRVKEYEIHAFKKGPYKISTMRLSIIRADNLVFQNSSKC